MNWKLGFILAAALLCGGISSKAEEDRDVIQGTWILDSSERDGVVTNADKSKARDVRLIFEADQIMAKMGDKSVSLGSFSLDPSKDPKIYDRTYPDGSKRLGLYKLEGKTLTICVADLKKERPKEFVTRKGDGMTLVIYRRE